MSEMINAFKAKLYNFTQKAKKKTNEIVGTEMEVEPEITTEDVVDEDKNIKEENSDDNIKERAEIIKELKSETPKQEIKLTPYEKEIMPYYVGCYSDDPTNLSMKKYLGVVSNPVECIKRGKNNNYNFVGIQQGDKCYASNEIPNTIKVNDNHCNIRCNDPKTGTCGGYFYNKVYKTDLGNVVEKGIEKNDTFMLVENYNSMNTEMNDINRQLKNVYYDNNDYPINMYVLAVALLIIIIILYLVIEKLN